MLRILDRVISRRRWGALLGLVAAGASGSVGLASCGGGGRSSTTVEPVRRATVTETVDAPATVAPKAQGSVAATADGSVTELRVRDGQQVRVGQVLLRVASPTATRQLREAKAADAAAARPPAATTGPLAGAGPAFDVARVQQQLATAMTAAARALDGADAAARQLPAGRLRAQAHSGVAQLRAQLATSQAAAESALAQVGSGVSAATGQLAQVGGQLQAAVAALGTAQRAQTRAAVRVAQSAVDGLVVRAPVAGTVQLGTGAPAAAAAAGGGADLGALLAQLPVSVSGSLGGLGGATAGAPAAPGGPTSTAPVTEGSPVRAGGLLATVFDTSTLMLDADVDETDVLAVRPGVEADVQLDAVPGAHYRGRVTSVESSTGSSARGGVSYRVHLSIGAGSRADGRPTPTPRPGMSAVASLAVRTDPNALALPAAAVVRDGERDTVWVRVAGRAVRRPVVLGARGEDTVAVESGVAEGDPVVTRGADAVRAGQAVG